MQYKFRGKRKDNGEWVYGDLWTNPTRPDMPLVKISTWIDENGTPANYEYVVVPETVGMWTGLKDKQGIDIYKDDIYLAERGYMPSRGYKKKGYPDRIKVICVVEWSIYDAGWFGRQVSPIKEHVEFSRNTPYDYLFTSLHGASDGNADWVEVIGNIHDNPHLLNPAKGAVTNTMFTDPNNTQAAPANQEAVGQEQATTNDGAGITAQEVAEQEAQEKALESEEGNTEG